MLTDISEKRFLLVSIVSHHFSEQQVFANVEELIKLVESYEGKVVDIVLQNREVHDKGMYIGKGKINEVSQIVTDKKIDVVVLNDVIRPSQIYDIQVILEENKVGIQVWDKIDLILKIFSQHANTAEAKLQIELAAMYHMGPRIYGMGEEMSRQGGMVGTRGIGETNTERMKRHWRGQIKKVKDDLDKLAKNHTSQLDYRNKLGLKTVSLVGYTNAGKTSLFNRLTGKNRLVKDALFVTLDTAIGKMKISSYPFDVLVSDTIGFIQDLPPRLIEAFKSTLMESVQADLLLQVIDISDKDWERKIEDVKKIVKGLSLENKKIIYVFNKVDQVSDIDKNQIIKNFRKFSPQFISSKTGEGIDDLNKSIGKWLT